mmetsp:Transcript_37205/g.72131  ORF Transcript_37205/g.72131 Transcript_37205/m.72131 type:complete len:181 (-) Transcript_37205:241-783(-)
MLHHGLSVLLFGYGVFTPRMHFFASLDCLCEVATIPLNNLHLWQAFRLPKTERPLKYLYIGNGLLLWTMYLVFRVILFPMWFVYYVHDIYLRPEISWNTLNGFEKVFSWSVNLFLLVISFIWFREINKGLLKALRRGSNRASDEATSKCLDQAQPPSNGRQNSSNGNANDKLRQRHAIQK